MFQNVYWSDGRIRRTEYGFSLVIAATGAVVMENILTYMHADMAIYFCWLPSFIFMLSQGAKRCHDLGKSGWTQFLVFYIIFMLFEDGEPGFNRYGHNPKGAGEFELEVQDEEE